MFINRRLPFHRNFICRICLLLTYQIQTRLTSSFHLAIQTITFRFYITIITENPLSHSKQFCFLCGVLIPSSVLVQLIEILPDRVSPSDNDMNSSSLIILNSLLYPSKIHLAEITPQSLLTKEYFF